MRHCFVKTKQRWNTKRDQQAVPRFFSPSLWRVSFSKDVCGFLHLKPSYSTSRQSSRATKKQSTILTPSAASVCHVTLALPIIMVPGDFLSSQAVLTSCLILFIFFARLVAFLDLILPSRLSVNAAQSFGPQGISGPLRWGVIQENYFRHG